MAIIPIPDDLSSDQEVAAAEIRDARQGRLPDLFRIMLHSSDVARGWLSLGTAIRYRSSLDDDVRETLITFVAQARGCAHEVAAHAPLAEAAGVSASALDDLPEWRSSSEFGPALRTALAVADAVVAGGAPVPDVVTAAVEEFGERGVLEVVALVGYYTAVAVFMDGIGLYDTPGE